ncbi:hypothetical protein [Salipiger abyssi]|uniref:Uncharacterized protein n=1 Tax=Salipiger abyssi TaxID=1250539 RepID=A0A1P8UYK0_9RHOB|nr:hypothetical protein [Salipiger abyssi]APZ54461.1 hypothetical protein Ga0080574_TMP4127 [Salipiger abyssi]
MSDSPEIAAEKTGECAERQGSAGRTLREVNADTRSHHGHRARSAQMHDISIDIGHDPTRSGPWRRYRVLIQNTNHCFRDRNMSKFYLPILELLVAGALIYLIPEGLYKVAQRVFGRAGDRLEFIANNVRGFLIGSVVALGFLFAFGVSYEDFVAGLVRNTASEIRRVLGFDPIDRCVARTKEVFRFTPMQFTSEASSQGLTPANGLTFSTREELLSHGWEALILREGNSPEDVYEISLRKFCISRIQRGVLNF